MSSANFNILPVTPLSKSLMYTNNKIGPSRGEGAKSHRGKMSLAQNSIMQMGKFLDNAPVGYPKQ